MMIERCGWTRCMQDCGAGAVDGQPSRLRVSRAAHLLCKVPPGEPESIVGLGSVNSTPEPGGRLRRHPGRIGPKACGWDAGRLCHAAAAWRWRHRDGGGRLRLSCARRQDCPPAAASRHMPHRHGSVFQQRNNVTRSGASLEPHSASSRI
jgi:hypothetical protein